MSVDIFEVLGETLAVGLSYYVIMICLGIAGYVLRSLGMYTIAKRRGLEKPWTAWVPIANYWLAGCISDQYRQVARGENKNKRKAMLILGILMVVIYVAFIALYAVTIVNIVDGLMYDMDLEVALEQMIAPISIISVLSLPLTGISIAQTVLWYMCMYDLYASSNPQNKTVFLVLSIFFNVAEPFFIFFSRNKDDGMRPEPRNYPQYPMYQPPQYYPPQYQPPQYPQSQYQAPQYPQSQYQRPKDADPQ